MRATEILSIISGECGLNERENVSHVDLSDYETRSELIKLRRKKGQTPTKQRTINFIGEF